MARGILISIGLGQKDEKRKKNLLSRLRRKGLEKRGGEKREEALKRFRLGPKKQKEEEEEKEKEEEEKE